MVPYCTKYPAPPGFTDSYRANTSIPQVQGYRFQCLHPEDRVVRTENRWSMEQSYGDPYQSPVLNRIESGPELDEVLKHVRASVVANGKSKSLSLESSARVLKAPMEGDQAIKLEFLTSFKREHPCGKRVEHYDGSVIYSCVVPGKDPVSRQYTLKEEKERLERGETLAPTQEYYPSHFIEFDIYSPKETE